MPRTLAVLLLVLCGLALLAACDDEGDFLFERQPEVTGTPPFDQRSPEPSPEPSPTTTPTPTVVPTPGVCGETYIVEAGDFPFLIAEKCGVDPDDVADWSEDLLELNEIDDPTSLKVGQELRIPQ